MEARATGRRDELPAGSRYELLVKLASGGMATVYVGRSTTAVSRLFAIKRAHAHLVDDPVFRRMFVIEGRLAARIHHPNVVSVQDVAELSDELLLVMDYVEGLALVDVEIADPKARVSAANRIVLDACAGLHAAHEQRGDDGEPLDIVHRDVSPHNILVGVDGIARITDFGIAKSGMYTGNATVTGALKGKLAYMAPEYIESGTADRRADVYALGVVLWEALTGARLFRASSEIELMKLVLNGAIDLPSSRNAEVTERLDAVVRKALARGPEDRFATADAFAAALEEAARKGDALSSHRDVAALVERQAHETLTARREALRARTTRAPGDDEALPEPERTETLAPPPVPSRAPAVTAPAPEPSRKRAPLVAAGFLLAAVLGFFALRPSTPPDPPPQIAAPRTAPPPPSTPTQVTAPVSERVPVASTPSPVQSAVSTTIMPRAVAPMWSAPALASAKPPPSAPAASAATAPTPSVAPPNPYLRDAAPAPGP